MGASSATRSAGTSSDPGILADVAVLDGAPGG